MYGISLSNLIMSIKIEQREMESKEKMELIQLTIQQLIDEQRDKKLSSSSDESSFVADGGDDHHLLLSRLLSQLETLKGHGKLQQPEPPADPKELPSPAVAEAKSETAKEVEGGGVDDSGREEIVTELRELKKQNFITHCLLSAMIVLTITWQLSEVSLVFKLKDGLTHPFKTFGGMLEGMLKGPTQNAQNREKKTSTKQQQIEVPAIPPLKIPELPHLDLPLVLDSHED